MTLYYAGISKEGITRTVLHIAAETSPAGREVLTEH